MRKQTSTSIDLRLVIEYITWKWRSYTI